MTESVYLGSLKEGEVCPKTGIWKVGGNAHFVPKEFFEKELCKVIEQGAPAPKVPHGFPCWFFHKEIESVHTPDSPN